MARRGVVGLSVVMSDVGEMGLSVMVVSDVGEVLLDRRDHRVGSPVMMSSGSKKVVVLARLRRI